MTAEIDGLHQERMPPTASLMLIHYFLVLATVNLVITIPTANEYAERLGGGRLLLGSLGTMVDSLVVGFGVDDASWFMT